MDTIKVNHGQTKMIAHRGLSFLERENTNAAFIAAGNRSYYGIETDVRKTADGQFVLLHARSTGEYTHDTVDIAIATNDYAAIKNLVLDDLDGSSDRQDLKVPLLVEYIKICKKYDKKCVLEIKDFFSREDIIKVIDIHSCDKPTDEYVYPPDENYIPTSTWL